MPFRSSIHRGWITIVLGLLVTAGTYAQRARLDSMRTVIRTTANDSVRMDLHRRVAFMYFTSSVDTALLHIDSAQVLADRVGDSAIYARMFAYRGLGYRLAGEYSKGLVQLDSADHYFLRWNDERNIAQGLFQRGVIYSLQGDLEKSMEMYMQELAMHEKVGRTYGIANDHNSIGILFKKMGDCDKALEHFNKSLKLFKELGRPMDEANVINGIGTCMVERGNLRDALPYFKEALRIDLELAAEWGIATQYQNIGQVHLGLGELGKARSNTARSINLFSVGGYERELMLGQIYYSEIMAKLGLADSALFFLNKAKKIGVETGAMDQLATAYCQLADLYANGQRFQEALTAQRRCDHLRDSLLSAENIARINELEIQYGTAKKDQRISEQDLQLVQRDADVRRRNLWIAIALGLGALIVTILLFKIRSAQQKRKLEQAQLEQLRNEKKIGYAKAMINGQEAERGRIAKDLHDGLGAILATAKLHLGKVQQGIEQLESMKIHEQASNLIETAYTEVRRISHDMMPGSLEKFGLVKALGSLCAGLSKDQLHADVNAPELDQRLPKDIEVALYRIAQEAANNMLKYAEATEFNIMLEVATDAVHMRISDNGKGFDPTISTAKGLGLSNMRSRAGFLGGDVDISSIPGKGTNINVKIPMKHV